MPIPKKYKAIRKEKKAEGRAVKSAARTTASNLKRGGRMVAKGSATGDRVATKMSTTISPSKRLRKKATDAAIKVDSGRKIIANAAGGKKLKGKTKSYKTVPAPGMPGKYINSQGKVVARKKRR